MDATTLWINIRWDTLVTEAVPRASIYLAAICAMRYVRSPAFYSAYSACSISEAKITPVLSNCVVHDCCGFFNLNYTI